MALINITPTMTSNTTPSPYVVSASSQYSEIYAPWKAFDGKTGYENTWGTISNTPYGWIKIDFGIEKRIDAFSVTSRNYTDQADAPKTMILYGSNDDSNYSQILEVNNQILWSSVERRLFNLPNPVSYRYYRLNCIQNNGKSNYVVIGEITLYQDDGVTPVENNKTVSRRYTLPYGSKLRLDNLTSDLNYMLATECDGNNEGTLRLVNHAGKLIVPKAGQKIRKLWGGVATSISTLILEDNVENYSSIMLIVNYPTTSGSAEGKTAKVYPMLESEYVESEFLFNLSVTAGSNVARNPYMYFKVKGNLLNITSIGDGGWRLPRLISVYGIY